MSKRIGELLIERGLLTPNGLDRALRAQLIFGGHLGTNLIELGLVDEDALSDALSELLRIPQATRAMLDAVPEEVVGRLSPQQVEKHQVIPIALRDKELHVAVIHPKHLGMLSQRTGMKIVPHVAPEFCIFEAMETYYGIPRRRRYVTLRHELEGRETPAPTAPPPPAASPCAQQGPAIAAAEPAAPEAIVDLAMLGDEFGYGRDWREILEQKIDRVQPAERPDGFEGLSDRLSRAENRQDLASALLDFCAESMSGCILFGVRSAAAFVWDWRRMELSPELVKTLRLPITAGSIFTLLLGQSFYRGPVPDDPSCGRFYTTLQRDPPEEILILPVYLDDRLMAILYGERDAGAWPGAGTEEYLRMREKFSLALNLLILKHKIRSV